MCTENPPTLLGKEKCCSIIAKLYEKRKRNLENDKFSSIETPKTSLVGTMGEHKKGPLIFSGYQNSIPLLI